MALVVALSQLTITDFKRREDSKNNDMIAAE